MTSTSILVGIILIVVCAIVTGMFIMVAKRKLKGIAMIVIRDSWHHAKKQDNLTLRIVEADKVLDEALRLLGFTGTLGEKLKKSGPRFSDLNGVWTAHKLRNTLVHELQKKPSEKEVHSAMAAFERGLKDLGM